MSTATATRPAREAKNTYRLPRGEATRRELARWFRRQRAAVLGWLRTGKIAVKRDAGDLPEHFPDFEAFGLGNLAMSERMTPHLAAIWADAGAKFNAKIGLDPDDWEVTNPHTKDAIDQASLAFCESTNATTSLDLDEAIGRTREALAKGLIDRGESVADLTKRIKAIFDGAETWRARRIAASEASRAVHAAQEMAAKDSGVVAGWKWLLSADACPLCQTVARRVPTVKLGQAFAVIGDDPHYSVIRHPPLHPGCQCSLQEILDIDPQPTWGATLHDPEPEERDYAPGEAPAATVAKPKPPGYTNPDAFRLPVRNPATPTPAEPIGDYLPSDEEIAKPKKKPKPPKAPPKKKPRLEGPEFPGPAEKLETVRDLGGSTGAKLVKDPRGNLWVQKKGKGPDHLREEAAADALYRAMGLDVPPSRVYETPGGPVKLSRYLEGRTLGSLRTADPDAFQAAKLKLREGFAADALMGNWDVIGSGGDNILVTADGKVFRIDNGGSLRFRAQGAKKSATQWSGTVGELTSLRDPAINPDAAKVFAGLTEDEVRGQIKALVKRRAAILKAAPDEIKEVLGQRLDYMAGWAKPQKPVKVGNWKPKPAESFRKITDLEKWSKEHYDAWAAGLTPKELAAVKDYTGPGYHKLNQYLRGQTTLKPDNYKIVPDLDAAMNKAPAPHNMVVYRGGGFDFFRKLGLQGWDDIRPGMDLGDKGYTSTSPDLAKAWSGPKIEIRVAKGTPGAYVDKISSHKGEKEFLIGREVDTFRVVEVHRDRETIVVEALRSDQLKRGKK